MRFIITGHSMEPTLKEYDRIWASFFLRKPRKGDIVVFRNPHRGKTLLIKRIAEKLENDRYAMKGDNPNDSLDVGIIARNELIAKAYLCYAPKGHTRWL